MCAGFGVGEGVVVVDEVIAADGSDGMELMVRKPVDAIIEDTDQCLMSRHSEQSSPVRRDQILLKGGFASQRNKY